MCAVEYMEIQWWMPCLGSWVQMFLSPIYYNYMTSYTIPHMKQFTLKLKALL